jgi:Domain of unknown function (DUF5916)
MLRYWVNFSLYNIAAKKRLMQIRSIASAILILCCYTAKGQDTAYLSKPPLKIHRLKQVINFDGLSNEPAWSEALSVPFMASDPVWGQAPTEKTELQVGFDDRYLYVAGRCFTQDSNSIIGRTLVRDGYRNDDWMTFQVDSRFDRQNALVFSIHPLGARFDLATSNDAIELGTSTFNATFNMFWEAKTVMNKAGWFYEMKIPLYNLRYKNDSDGNVAMAISATRAIQRKQEYHQFPALPQNAIDGLMKPSLKQPVVFMNLPRQRLFLVTPYLLTSRARNYQLNVDKTNYEKNIRERFQTGLDAKIGLSAYLTLDLTANPDFSQVEADDQLVNLTRFSLFFPERRLFFQEQAGLFEFSLGGASQLFYSRRIGINEGQLTSIYGGARLTGKLDSKTDIGVLNMQTAPTNLNDNSKLPSENFGVLRLRRKIWNDRSFMGAMFTSRSGANRQNYAFGTDALINPKNNHYLIMSASSVFDKTENTPQKSGLGATRFSFLWENRKLDGFFHRVGYTYSGADYDPAIGFVDRTNYHYWLGSLSYGKFAKARKGLFQYKRFNFLNTEGFNNAQSGKLESMLAQSNGRFATFKGTVFTPGIEYNYEFVANELDFGNGVTIAPDVYRFTVFRLGFAPPRFKNIRVPIRVSEGGFFGGRRFNFNLSPLFNLGKNWEVQGNYDYSYLRFAEKDLYRHIHILRLRVNYAMNLHLSASLISQYNSNAKQFFNNFRLRYNFRDGHDLFMVWNENFFSDRRIIDRDVLRPVSGDQAFILKYSYTFDRVFQKRRKNT